MHASRLTPWSGNLRAAGRIAAAAVVVSVVPLVWPDAMVAQTPTVAQTTKNTPDRLESFAKLPDWRGIWRVRGFGRFLDDNATPRSERDFPPYTPEFEAKYKVDLVRAEHQGDPDFPNPLVDSHTVYCAAGFPKGMSTPFDYEFIVTPEKTWITIDKETRHIYTDGRAFPPEDERWPTFMGTSIGRWEGQELVIETISVRSGIWLDMTPAMLSGEARFAERIRQIDADTLEDRVTITDPVALTKPWTFTKRYGRQKQLTWVSEPELCGNPEDRNPVVNGRLMLVLPDQK